MNVIYTIIILPCSKPTNFLLSMGAHTLSNDKKRKEEFHSLQLFYPYCIIFFLVEIRSSRNDIAFFHK